MTISDSLTGRRALVTGGSKGQGAAIVARLREAGATVMTTARTMPHDAAHRDLFIAADLSTPAEPRRSSTRSVPDWAPSTSWSTSSAARTHPSGGFAALSDEHWQAELNLNLLSAVRLDRGLLRR